MKKLLCMLLVSILCLSLFSCSSKNAKYVGEYTRYITYGVPGKYYDNALKGYVHTDAADLPVKESIILNKDGTGLFSVKENEKQESDIIADEVKAKHLEQTDLKWSVEDGYLIISYYDNGEKTYSETFEKKGAELIDVKYNGVFTKVD